MPVDTERRLSRAVLNNVAWCDAVCRAAGGTCHSAAALWTNRVASPRGYPNAITLVRTADSLPAELAALAWALDDASDWGVKDSFATLDLARSGFVPLFDAQWMFRAARPGTRPVRAAPLGWRRVRSAPALGAWEAAWAASAVDAPAPGRVFSPALLDDPDIAFLGRHDGDRLVCGAVASRGAGVLGLSNLFARPVVPDDWREQALAAVQASAPGLDLVGYESAAGLDHFRALGFETLGPLRVWLHRSAS